jgi:hypothetical protein
MLLAKSEVTKIDHSRTIACMGGNVLAGEVDVLNAFPRVHTTTQIICESLL